MASKNSQEAFKIVKRPIHFLSRHGSEYDVHWLTTCTTPIILSTAGEQGKNTSNTSMMRRAIGVMNHSINSPPLYIHSNILAASASPILSPQHHHRLPLSVIKQKKEQTPRFMVPWYIRAESHQQLPHHLTTPLHPTNNKQITKHQKTKRGM